MSYIKFGSTLPDFVKKFREERGLNQAELAKICGVTDSYISLIESGRRKFPLAFCSLLLDVVDAERAKFLKDLMEQMISDQAAFRLQTALKSRRGA